MPYIEPNLVAFEKKERSQFGEDGVIEKIADCLRIKKGTFLEFGIGPTWNRPIEEGLEGNFVRLRQIGWDGVFFDGTIYPHEYDVRQEFVTPLNINRLYKKHNISDDLDFISIDVDGQEFWIWMALQARPKVVIVEYNGGKGGEESVSIQFDVAHVWDGTTYHGASLRAFQKLADDKGYILVWANGVNAAFIRSDLVSNKEDFAFEKIFRSFPPHAADIQDRAWVEI